MKHLWRIALAWKAKLTQGVELLLLTGRNAKFHVEAAGTSMIGSGHGGGNKWRQVGVCRCPATCRRRGGRGGAGI